MYVLHRLHRAITVSVARGTGGSPSFKERYGVMTSPKGILALFSNEDVVGTALMVQREYDASALEVGEGPRAAF